MPFAGEKMGRNRMALQWPGKGTFLSLVLPYPARRRVVTKWEAIILVQDEVRRPPLTQPPVPSQFP